MSNSTTAEMDSTKSCRADQHRSPSQASEDQDAEYDFRFYVVRNIRYHSRRASFFGYWHRLTAFVGVVFGSSAAISFFASGSPKIASALAAVVVIFSAIDLVVGAASRESLHNELRRRWVALQRRFESDGLSHELQIEKRSIEMDEPPELPIVELQAYNDASLSILGKEAHEHLITFKLWQKLLGQVMSLDTTKLHKEADDRQAAST
ncbi:hypothetical protein [Vreelandella alkaliphila]|uniref:hypothetical protein n=1 Tax=Halomonadaceae TaxID=28256 RepID=UPI0012FD469E|nr:hypothetical protein [Halomonas sp. N3-2A]